MYQIPTSTALHEKYMLLFFNESSWVSLISKHVVINALSKMYLSYWGFPSGSVVKNPPVNAGDRGSSPESERSHMPWSNWALVPQPLSLRSRAREPQLLKPTSPGARALQQEKPLQREARAPQQSSPCSSQLEEAAQRGRASVTERGKSV